MHTCAYCIQLVNLILLIKYPKLVIVVIHFCVKPLRHHAYCGFPNRDAMKFHRKLEDNVFFSKFQAEADINMEVGLYVAD